MEIVRGKFLILYFLYWLLMDLDKWELRKKSAADTGQAPGYMYKPRAPTALASSLQSRSRAR